MTELCGSKAPMGRPLRGTPQQTCELPLGHVLDCQSGHVRWAQPAPRVVVDSADADQATLEAQERADKFERALLDIRPQLTVLAGMRRTAKRYERSASVVHDAESFAELAEQLEAVRLRMKNILDGAL